MKTILIIEDDLNILNAYSLFLKKRGFRVLKAKNCYEGLDALLNEHVDLIISDINLPEKSGLILVKQIRRILKYKHIPIIILSGYCTKQNVFRGVELGIDAFLTKPCTKDKLYSTVDSVLGSTKSLKNEVKESRKSGKHGIDPSNRKTILLTYDDAKVTDHLCEYLSERFNKILIDTKPDSIFEVLKSHEIDLLIIGITDSRDEFFKTLFRRYEKNYFLEIPTILITENKYEIEMYASCFDFKVDKILSKPYKYDILLRSIIHVTEPRYIRKKWEACIKFLEKKIKENKHNESEVVQKLRKKIILLESENLEIYSSRALEKNDKFRITGENHNKIKSLASDITAANKKYLHERQNIINSIKSIQSKLKSLLMNSYSEKILTSESIYN
ncbi:response regulator [candidate division KSB1 bacterium]